MWLPHIPLIGGTLENARAIAAQESSQTTRLYDRTGDKITLDEVERIVIRGNQNKRVLLRSP